MTGIDPNSTPTPDPEEQLDRERLAADLRALLGAEKDSGPPQHVRDAVRARAAMALRARRTSRRWRVTGGVVAASLLLFATSVFLLDVPTERFGAADQAPASARLDEKVAEAASAEEQAERATPGDLDGNGRLDVRDARLLALSQAEGGATLDLNGDGRSDGADVDLLLARVVRLEGR